MNVDVALIIVTHNSSHVIGPLLDSVPRAMGDLTYSTIVVDNDSKDGTADVVDVRGDATVVRAPNLGYAGGINLGVANSAPSRAVLILNPDLVLDTDSVEYMMETMSEFGAGIVAPAVRESDGSISTSLRREPTLPRSLGLSFTGIAALSESLNDHRDYAVPQVVDWALGAVLLVSRECFDELEGWDATFFLYSEETDFCLRARDRGWSTRFDPRAGAIHAGGGSGQSAWTYSMLILNRVRLYRRRHSAPPAWAYYVLAIVTELSRTVRGNPYSLAAVRALIMPRRRPAELNCSSHLIPN